MTQFDTVAISSFVSTMLGFAVSVSFFLHAKTNVTNCIHKAVKMLGVAALTAELKLLRALSGARLQLAYFALIFGLTSFSGLMKFFFFFLKANFSGIMIFLLSANLCLLIKSKASCFTERLHPTFGDNCLV